MWAEVKGRVILAMARLSGVSIGAVSTAVPRLPETITKETTVHPRETITLKASVSLNFPRLKSSFKIET